MNLDGGEIPIIRVETMTEAADEGIYLVERHGVHNVPSLKVFHKDGHFMSVQPTDTGDTLYANSVEVYFRDPEGTQIGNVLVLDEDHFDNIDSTDLSWYEEVMLRYARQFASNDDLPIGSDEVAYFNIVFPDLAEQGGIYPEIH